MSENPGTHVESDINPRRILRSDIVAGVPARWAAQYPRGRYSSDKDVITDQLEALVGRPFTAEQVNSIIGNDSWTENRCDGCDQNHDVLIRIGEEPDYEAQWLDLCVACIDLVCAAAKAVRAQS